MYRGTSEIPAVQFTDPACIRSWFHNGAPGWQKKRALNYYGQDSFSIQLKDFEIEAENDLGSEEYYDAVRSLAGKAIRVETYGLKNGVREEHPFQVTHNSYIIRRTQPGTKVYNPGFIVYPKENLEIIYEKDPNDPRIIHRFSIENDAYGAPLKQAAVAYPRVHPEALEEQRVLHISAAKATVVHFDTQVRYELGIPLESESFELHDAAIPEGDNLYSFQTIKALVHSNIETPLAFDEAFSLAAQARRVQWSKNYYWNNDRSAVLAWGEVATKALPHHQEAACFHTAFLENTMGDRYDPSFVTDGYYTFHDGLWWQPGAIVHFGNASEFYVPVQEVHHDGGYVGYRYDTYHLTLLETTAVLVDSVGAVLAGNSNTALDRLSFPCTI